MKSRRRRIIFGVLLIVFGLPVAFVATVLMWTPISDKTSGTIVSSGVTRQYRLYVPKTYDRTKATPLVISQCANLINPRGRNYIAPDTAVSPFLFD